MRPLFTLLLLAFSSLGIAQNTGMIVGNVVDKELNNGPLIYADISIKGTSVGSTTDMTGLFHIENLEDGDYTLVCSFVGYETKEVNVHVSSAQPTDINIQLAASTVSLNELASLGNIATSNDKTPVASNK